MWHQLWSCSSVRTTISASSAPGEPPPTVTRAVCAPESRARRSAPFVAAVPPSCETPMTSPLAGGRRWSSSAWMVRISRSASSPRASVSRWAIPIAACSDVPQPVVRIGAPARAASATAAASRASSSSVPSLRTSRSANAGSASIISPMTYGGRLRNAGIADGSHGSGAPGSGSLAADRGMRQLASGRMGMRSPRSSATSIARS